MKESEMWQRIGEHIEKHDLRSSLCLDGARLFSKNKNAYLTLSSRVRPHLMLSIEMGERALSGPLGYSYAYPVGEEADARILAAYWLALECKEEEKIMKIRFRIHNDR